MLLKSFNLSLYGRQSLSVPAEPGNIVTRGSSQFCRQNKFCLGSCHKVQYAYIGIENVRQVSKHHQYSRITLVTMNMVQFNNSGQNKPIVVTY